MRQNDKSTQSGLLSYALVSSLFLSIWINSDNFSCIKAFSIHPPFNFYPSYKAYYKSISTRKHPLLSL